MELAARWPFGDVIVNVVLRYERRADVYWDSVALRGRRKRIAAVLTAFGYPLRHVNV